MEIRKYTAAQIEDVLEFERAIRAEEDFWGWDIDEAYGKAVRESFDDPKFANAVSLLAYDAGRVVGRIDAALICSRFDGKVQAYLDWICVVKSCRHKGTAQALLGSLRALLHDAYGVTTLIALMARNDEAQRFYRSIENASIHDEAIWITC